MITLENFNTSEYLKKQYGLQGEFIPYAIDNDKDMESIYINKTYPGKTQMQKKHLVGTQYIYFRQLKNCFRAYITKHI